MGRRGVGVAALSLSLVLSPPPPPPLLSRHHLTHCFTTALLRTQGRTLDLSWGGWHHRQHRNERRWPSVPASTHPGERRGEEMTLGVCQCTLQSTNKPSWAHRPFSTHLAWAYRQYERWMTLISPRRQRRCPGPRRRGAGTTQRASLLGV
jgi:hypothetical protein